LDYGDILRIIISAGIIGRWAAKLRRRCMGLRTKKIALQ
jgi:hypothetical protein